MNTSRARTHSTSWEKIQKNPARQDCADWCLLRSHVSLVYIVNCISSRCSDWRFFTPALNLYRSKSIRHSLFSWWKKPAISAVPSKPLKVSHRAKTPIGKLRRRQAVSCVQIILILTISASHSTVQTLSKFWLGNLLTPSIFCLVALPDLSIPSVYETFEFQNWILPRTHIVPYCFAVAWQIDIPIPDVRINVYYHPSKFQPNKMTTVGWETISRRQRPLEGNNKFQLRAIVINVCYHLTKFQLNRIRICRLWIDLMISRRMIRPHSAPWKKSKNPTPSDSEASISLRTLSFG